MSGEKQAWLKWGVPANMCQLALGVLGGHTVLAVPVGSCGSAEDRDAAGGGGRGLSIIPHSQQARRAATETEGVHCRSVFILRRAAKLYLLYSPQNSLYKECCAEKSAGYYKSGSAPVSVPWLSHSLMKASKDKQEEAEYEKTYFKGSLRSFSLSLYSKALSTILKPFLTEIYHTYFSKFPVMEILCLSKIIYLSIRAVRQLLLVNNLDVSYKNLNTLPSCFILCGYENQFIIPYFQPYFNYLRTIINTNVFMRTYSAFSVEI